MITYETKTCFTLEKEVEENKEVKYTHATITYTFDEI